VLKSNSETDKSSEVVGCTIETSDVWKGISEGVFARMMAFQGKR
jgi:hypothetical protein